MRSGCVAKVFGVIVPLELIKPPNVLLTVASEDTCQVVDTASSITKCRTSAKWDVEHSPGIPSPSSAAVLVLPGAEPMKRSPWMGYQRASIACQFDFNL
jgi:hypothetical protein